MSKITSGRRVRIFTAEELNIDPATYRYANHGGVVMWAAFPAPNNPHVFYLTADKDAVTDVCPWSKLEQALEKTGINHMVRAARINELKRKYLGPIAFNCLKVLDEAQGVRTPIVDVNDLSRSIDAYMLKARTVGESQGMTGDVMMRHLKTERRKGIINYLDSYGIPYTDSADDDSFALEA